MTANYARKKRTFFIYKARRVVENLLRIREFIVFCAVVTVCTIS